MTTLSLVLHKLRSVSTFIIFSDILQSPCEMDMITITILHEEPEVRLLGLAQGYCLGLLASHPTQPH